MQRRSFVAAPACGSVSVYFAGAQRGYDERIGVLTAFPDEKRSVAKRPGAIRDIYIPMSNLISIVLAGALSLLAAFVARRVRSKLKLHQARKAESEGRFSESYQLYCVVVFAAGQSFTLPQPKKFESTKDVQDWITKCATAYTNYVLEKPADTNLRESAAKLKSLETHLAYLENRLESKRSTKLTLDDYVDFFKSAYFPDQKEVPEKTRKHAQELYDSHVSIVCIEGDSSSHVEGCFYSVERNLSAKYAIDYDPGAGAVVFLAPGDWVVVSRIVPELSNPKDKAWREARDLRGRYAATFLTVPEASHAIWLSFIPRLARFEWDQPTEK